jgi:hypothetical protein
MPFNGPIKIHNPARFLLTLTQLVDINNYVKSVDFWASALRSFCSFSAKELFRQAQCLVKVFIARFVKGCLRQTPRKMKVLVLAARGKCRFLRLLKTTNVLAHS